MRRNRPHGLYKKRYRIALTEPRITVRGYQANRQKMPKRLKR